MRARAVIGSILLLLSALLAACGEESATTKPGDVIRAQSNDQFRKGRETTVALPTGRLLIYTEDPVDSAGTDDTRSREEVDAPAGAVLLPITWQYDTWASDRLNGIVATEDTPRISLVSDGEGHPLSPPDKDAKAGQSFYVVVDGDAKDAALEVEFDGVTQTVNLLTRGRDAGKAEALYEIEDARLQKQVCDEGEWFDTRTAAAEFTCEIIGPVLTSYAAGEWAPDGRLWLALTLTTGMGTYAEVLLGGGARYAPVQIKLDPTIDGDSPDTVLSSDTGKDLCPVPVLKTCGWSRHLIFEVPSDDGEQGPLDLDLSYKLELLNSWGAATPERRKTVEATESFKMWSDQGD